MKPKISLALFNYCQTKYLPDSLNALLTQTDPPDEILLFDDASTDNSIDLLEKVPSAKFIFNTTNQGIIKNVEKAIEIAEHDYIVLFAADDVIHPNFIAERRKLIERRSDLGLVCSDCVFFEDKLPYKYEIYRFLPFASSQIFLPKESIAFFRKTGFTVLSFTCLYNRHLLKKYGGYRQELKSLADFYLNTQIALRHPIGYIPQPLAAARLVANSYGEALRKNWKEREKMYIRLFELVCHEECPAFRKAFEEARLLSFGGLYTLYYILCNPRYWFCLRALLLKNWKVNLYKIWCISLGRSFPRLPIKPVIAKWP